MVPINPSVQPSAKVLVDPFNRRLNYMRLSITDRCNLRCIYCVPDGFFPKLRHSDILSYEEILRLIQIAARLGVTKVRVTGGEPLIRKGVYGFMEKLNGVEGLSEISLTTNGVYLGDQIERIRRAGIRRVNISLDTLKRDKYRKITGLDRFDAVWNSLRLAREAGFHPIKINMVVIRGVNEDEVSDFARLSIDHPFAIRFIEYMPIGSHCMNIQRQILAPEIRNQIESIGTLEPISRSRDDGPAERYRFSGASGEIGFIQPISHHFCHECNRLRLTASGQLRVCLLSNIHVDLKGPMREGASDADLSRILIRAVRQKPREHGLACKQTASVTAPMSAIGG